MFAYNAQIGLLFATGFNLAMLVFEITPFHQYRAIASLKQKVPRAYVYDNSAKLE